MLPRLRHVPSTANEAIAPLIQELISPIITESSIVHKATSPQTMRPWPRLDQLRWFRRRYGENRRTTLRGTEPKQSPEERTHECRPTLEKTGSERLNWSLYTFKTLSKHSIIIRHRRDKRLLNMLNCSICLI